MSHIRHHSYYWLYVVRICDINYSMKAFDGYNIEYLPKTVLVDTSGVLISVGLKYRTD